MDLLPTLPVAETASLAPSSTVSRMAVAAPDAVPDPDRTRGLNVTIGLRREGSSVVLAVQDDGRGFDMAKVQSYAGHGLQNMKERARALGADV